MWRWIKLNAEGVEAAAAVLTAILALVAVIGVKWQIDASDRIQREQAARKRTALTGRNPHFYADRNWQGARLLQLRP